MKKQHLIILIAITVTLIACEKSSPENSIAQNSSAEIIEVETMENIETTDNSILASLDHKYLDHKYLESHHSDSDKGLGKKIKIVTFNAQGGSYSKLKDFRDNYLHNNVDILCLQEINWLENVDDLFDFWNEDGGAYNGGGSKKFPYFYHAWNTPTKSYYSWENPPHYNRVVVLSKYPIIFQQDKNIKTDPGGDKWERKANWVYVVTKPGELLTLFHYHNTYNWGNNNSESEKDGMQKFENWINEQSYILNPQSSRMVVLGDFNLGKPDVENIMGTDGSDYHYQSYGVDHILTSNPLTHNSSGVIYVPSSVSDHDAVWVKLDLRGKVSEAKESVIRGYEHGGYDGEIFSYFPNWGACTNINFFNDYRGANDNMSSIRVPSGITAKLYEHYSYSGSEFSFQNNTSDFGNHGCHDIVSSVKAVSD